MAEYNAESGNDSEVEYTKTYDAQRIRPQRNKRRSDYYGIQQMQGPATEGYTQFYSKARCQNRNEIFIAGKFEGQKTLKYKIGIRIESSNK